MALDSSGTPTIVDEVPFQGKQYGSITGYEADASTAIELVAAPGVGKAIYVLSCAFTSNDANAYPQLQDEDDNLIFGPVTTSTSGIAVVKEFKRPRKLASNKALELKAAAGGDVTVDVEYAIASG